MVSPLTCTARGPVVPHRGQVACTVDQGKHNEVATDDELSHRGIIELRNDPAALAHLLERSRAVADASHESGGIARGVLGDVLADPLQVPPGGLRPRYSSSDLANRRSTSSWGTTRPALTSSRPRSMRWRT
jgi:hypothetical protein